ncbi:hypothetical protein PHLGIDRAFT_17250, partial [Phlebiopsis gigantea 11061_1 CR5-6]
MSNHLLYPNDFYADDKLDDAGDIQRQQPADESQEPTQLVRINWNENRTCFLVFALAKYMNFPLNRTVVTLPPGSFAGSLVGSQSMSWKAEGCYPLSNPATIPKCLSSPPLPDSSSSTTLTAKSIDNPVPEEQCYKQTKPKNKGLASADGECDAPERLGRPLRLNVIANTNITTINSEPVSFGRDAEDEGTAEDESMRGELDSEQLVKRSDAQRDLNGIFKLDELAGVVNSPKTKGHWCSVCRYALYPSHVFSYLAKTMLSDLGARAWFTGGVTVNGSLDNFVEPTAQWNLDDSINHIVEYMVRSDVPLQTVDKDPFRRLLAYQCSQGRRINVPHQKRLHHAIVESAALVKVHLRDVFKRIQCLISLTFNVETPKALNTYIYISAHYIYASNDKPDEWSLKTNLLGTVRIEDYGRGENATTLAMRIVDQYGIRDKIEADVALGRKSTSPPSLWDQDSRMNVEGSAVSKNDCWPQAQEYCASEHVQYITPTIYEHRGEQWHHSQN